MKFLRGAICFLSVAVSVGSLLFAAPTSARRTKNSVTSAKIAANNQSAHRRSPYVGAMSIAADTGRVLFEENADAEAYPASVTKLMTAFLVLDDVSAGKLSLDEMVTASPARSKIDVHLRQPSCIGLRVGEQMSVDKLLLVMLVHSANDAAIFLAEKCAGTTDAFVERMNKKAAQLGMTSTCYYNPNGLPPMQGAKERKFNTSTCRDLAKLVRALLKEHPEILKYTSVKVCDVTLPNGEAFKRINHNNVMVKDKLKIINPDGTEAVDGLKTGYIDAGGSSVILTGSRKGKRAIVIVLGSASAKERDDNARHILMDALAAIAF